MKKLLTLFLVSAAISAVADTAATNGAYFNVNAGYATIQNLPTGAATLGVNAGYNFNQALAVEGGWSSMPSQQWDWLSSYNAYDVAVKGTIHLSNMFALYGRLGAAVGYSAWSGTMGSPMQYNSAGSATNLLGLAGIGASFTLSNHFDLRLEDYAYIPINQQVGSFGGANIVTGGFQYNF